MRYEDYIGWENVSKKKNLSKEFIREFADNLDWEILLETQNLDIDFIKEMLIKFSKYINPKNF